LADIVGGPSYARGVAYFQQGAVAQVWWDASRSALCGSVRGRTGEFYSTTAFFMLADELPPQFEDGRCSCPVGFNCKHVVALILAGTNARPVPARWPGPGWRACASRAATGPTPCGCSRSCTPCTTPPASPPFTVMAASARR